MADYRDDTNEIMVAGDEVQTTSHGAEESVARVGDIFTYRLRVFIGDDLGVSEQWHERAVTASRDALPVADSLTGVLRAAGIGGDVRRVRETLRHRIRAYTAEAVGIQDAVTGTAVGAGSESAGVSDEFTGHRRITSFIEDSLGASDASIQKASALIEEMISPADSGTGRLYARVRIVESVDSGDAHQEGGSSQVRTEDMVTVEDVVTGVLHAVQLIVDSAEVADEQARDEGYQSQAWTSNVDTWAMSRYAPYTFDGLAVIDGVLYGVAQDGVYALDGGADPVTGVIATGKLDLGRGSLVHPLGAYLEYELDGTAEMDVTTTQSGQGETYTYTLPQEAADELTNGRFLFGRGLRGRHFSFVLRIEGEHAYINDLRVDVAPTKRRV